jgi:peptidoglycan/LPS O-acetylase OafA/YrhL
MVQESVFRGVIGFFQELGIYDIVLPFLLVFTIVFAILEKTKILGTDKVEGTTITKKNLNAMVALVIAFLVIASTQLVAVINSVMANVVLLLILGVSFLMLVGVFFTDKEFSLENYPSWIKFFMVLMFIGVVVIFLNALDWLQFIFALFQFWDADWAAPIIFMIIIVAFMWFIVKEPAKKETKKEEKK